MRSHLPQLGVTMIEMLVAIAIMAILLSLAVPSFSTFLINMKQRAAVDNLYSGLHTARAEAIKWNLPTVFVLDPASGNWAVNLLNGNANPYPPTSANTFDTALCSGSAGVRTGNWCAPVAGVPTSACNYTLQKSCGEGTAATATPSASTSIYFSSRGRQTDVSGDEGKAVLVELDVCPAGATTVYSISVNQGGQIKKCDRSKSTGDPLYCNTTDFNASPAATCSHG